MNSFAVRNKLTALMVTFAYEWVAAKYNLTNTAALHTLYAETLLREHGQYGCRFVSDSEGVFARELRICKETGIY